MRWRIATSLVFLICISAALTQYAQDESTDTNSAKLSLSTESEQSLNSNGTSARSEQILNSNGTSTGSEQSLNSNSKLEGSEQNLKLNDASAGNNQNGGATFIISNPHSKGEFSPLLPESSIPYYPPPLVPYFDSSFFVNNTKKTNQQKYIFLI